MKTRHKSRRRANSTRWIVGVAIVAILAAGVLIEVSRASNGSAPVRPGAGLDRCGGPTCGQAGAPVTIEIYSDFQ